MEEIIVALQILICGGDKTVARIKKHQRTVGVGALDDPFA
jgi:hypothetical protein